MTLSCLLKTQFLFLQLCLGYAEAEEDLKIVTLLRVYSTMQNVFSDDLEKCLFDQKNRRFFWQTEKSEEIGLLGTYGSAYWTHFLNKLIMTLCVHSFSGTRASAIKETWGPWGHLYSGRKENNQEKYIFRMWAIWRGIYLGRWFIYKRG